ncbi:MAG: 2-aminoethylphosphonate--pyruvate transaminase [Pirellulales bacterium]|nr:2-aminoethylphosphonate--pyruvate transaminase [Pirellulales bacterium]
MDADIPYLLLTPGPLTTSKSVKEVMLRDYCTWDHEYNDIVTRLRADLVRLAGGDARHAAVLMQGSGTFSVEATIGSALPADGKLLVVNNGAYGKRIADIARCLRIACTEITQSEAAPADLTRIEQELKTDSAITHLALVHCETTTGILNPAAEAGQLARRYGKTFLLDAMSSFAGIEFTIDEVDAQFLVSSANKCLQGVPGFGLIVADRRALEATEGRARSLSLDLFDQWREMETKHGKWRYTSPTHTVRALAAAIAELDAEGGIAARARRYRENHRVLVEGMERLGFRPLVAAEHRSPIITSFIFPDYPQFRFETFYEALKRRRFVIYPGKVSQAETFRIGTIGHVFPDDMRELVAAIEEALRELGIRL